MDASPRRRRLDTYRSYLFGTPEFEARYYRETRTLVLHPAGAKVSDSSLLVLGGDLGERVAAMLIVLHMRQQLGKGTLATLMVGRGDHPWNAEAGWYRCAGRLLQRPAWQEAA